MSSVFSSILTRGINEHTMDEHSVQQQAKTFDKLSAPSRMATARDQTVENASRDDIWATVCTHTTLKECHISCCNNSLRIT